MRIKGIIRIEKRNIDITKLNSELATKLKIKGAEVTSNTTNAIYFNAGLRSLLKSKPYSNLLSVIGKGKLELYKKDKYYVIHYRLSFTEILAIGIIFSGIGLITAFILNSNIIFILLIPFWILVIVFGNIMITMHRFRDYLNEIIREL